MRRCSRIRKRIVLSAVDGLEPNEDVTVLEHLAGCPGCRRYSEEVRGLIQRLSAAGCGQNIEASEAFHRQAAEKLHAAQTSSAFRRTADWVRIELPNWRVAAPAMGIVVMSLLTLLVLRPHPVTEPGTAAVDPPALISAMDPAPTAANYAKVASQSLEELDLLLTRQGNRRLPPAPLYTAGGGEL